jgi:hypothetical protein
MQQEAAENSAAMGPGHQEFLQRQRDRRETARNEALQRTGGTSSFGTGTAARHEFIRGVVTSSHARSSARAGRR